MLSRVVVLFAVANALVPRVYAKSVTKPKQNGVCKPGEHWVRAHFQSAYVRSDGTEVAGSQHAAHCQSNPPSYAVWHERLKDGFPIGWEFKKEQPKAWTDSERERVLEALSSLPDDLLSRSVEGIYRMRSYLEYPANPAATHDHKIVLYDEAFKTGKNLARILAHEFAHDLYRQFYDEDMGRGYAKAADWASIPLPRSTERALVPGLDREGFVEEDGRSGPSEDFSNNIEYYLFNPTELKRKTPKVFDWISKKYGDKFKLGKGR